jgi:cell division protein FtsQ
MLREGRLLVTKVLDAPAEPTQRGREARRSWGLLGILVASIATLLWVVAFSPALGVRTVQVRGARSVSAADIESTADIAHGRPLVRVNTTAIERRVERLARVASASVRVSYPSTVVITVTERLAVGYLSDGATIRLVDRTGRQFQTAREAPKLPYLVASGAAAYDPATVRALATVAGALNATLRKEVKAVTGDDPDHIRLLLRDGRLALWGSADDSARKVVVLTALLRRSGQTFDVSDPALVVVR